MNVHELPMILFTVIGQMSVGAFWVLGVIHVYGYSKKMSPQVVDRITNTGLYAAGPLLVLGFVAAFFHLGDPLNALNTLRHVASSWQSREIASGIAYGVAGFAFASSQWFGWFSRGVRQVLAALTALAGFLLVATMAGTYYSVETIPAWHHPAVWVFFFGSAILTGSLAVGVALLITWNITTKNTDIDTDSTTDTADADASTTDTVGTDAHAGTTDTVGTGTGTDASATDTAGDTNTGTDADTGGGVVTRVRPLVRWRVVSGEPLSGELGVLTTRALAGICLAAALSGVAILVMYPLYVLDLANGVDAAREVAGRLLMPGTVVRLVLLAVVVVLAGVFAFVRARSAARPSRVLAWIIVSAFVLAVVSELLGRGMHYEGLYHVGLNTTQYLLGH